MDEFVDVHRAANTRPDEADTSGQDHDRAVALLLSGDIANEFSAAEVQSDQAKNLQGKMWKLFQQVD